MTQCKQIMSRLHNTQYSLITNSGGTTVRYMTITCGYWQNLSMIVTHFFITTTLITVCGPNGIPETFSQFQ